MATELTVSWIFDVISPFAYLGVKQLPQLPAHVRVEFVPVLFAGILNHHGHVGPAEIASKRRFTYRFVLWRARKMGIPLRFPPTHPFNPLAALRLIIAAGNGQQAIERMFDAVYAEGRDVSDPEVLASLAAELGIADPQDAVSAPGVKQRLQDNTRWAVEQGVFGVPTLRIGTENFWGHDAFEMALDYLSAPESFETDDMRAIETLPVGVTRVRPRQ